MNVVNSRFKNKIKLSRSLIIRTRSRRLTCLLSLLPNSIFRFFRSLTYVTKKCHTAAIVTARTTDATFGSALKKRASLCYQSPIHKQRPMTTKRKKKIIDGGDPHALRIPHLNATTATAATTSAVQMRLIKCTAIATASLPVGSVVKAQNVEMHTDGRRTNYNL